ncbi:MRPL22 [Cordylochernes scorpioides]|uniref:Large ribosomal subunit protein uL22m n=1 Tax=Cordylochernes scorpioides TaxID=51811 RepID=A0ABY6JW59_9ARAC|nr:MRPL22 [Cordylochernes scorpioides]
MKNLLDKAKMLLSMNRANRLSNLIFCLKEQIKDETSRPESLLKEKMLVFIKRNVKIDFQSYLEVILMDYLLSLILQHFAGRNILLYSARGVGMLYGRLIPDAPPAHNPAANRKKWDGPQVWPKYNEKMYPPLKPGEHRPAWVCHSYTFVKYSPDNMNLVASMIRGMSIDDAITQMTLMKKKGALAVKNALLEAQEMAVRDHNVEYKSNLWVAESFATKALVVKNLRRHARMRFGEIRHMYCHYFVRLEEGPPPQHYYTPNLTGTQKLEEYIRRLRMRNIQNSL